MPFRIFTYHQPFILESGRTLQGFHLAYTTHGKLNESKTNVVWIFHALTANSDPAEWWPGLVGENKLFDPAKYFIVCVNMPGSCYGSIAPLDIDAVSGETFYHNFPWFTTRDMIRAYQHLKDELSIQKIHIGIGGSMGGQQLLEWAIEEPDLFENIFPIATNAVHSPWAIAFNTSQRWSIENDVTWKEKNKNAGIEGMKIARSIALISYRQYATYNHSQKGFASDNETAEADKKIFKSETYQRYQGEKLAKRFNAFSYYFLSRSMDHHDVGRNRNGIEYALQKIKAKALVIGISSDLLFPVNEQKALVDYIPDAELSVINSQFGHDGFLLEFEAISNLIKKFLYSNAGTGDKLLTHFYQ
ncbi:MAG TPA: homoserine O-acetyltransferase [Chitinophagaceae bacterium]|nr:homoserine O-acetyltransferase [Chitinophagaceae bacterium]